MPQWLPAPLVNVEDFVVSSSGHLYVDSKLIGRVVRFDENGSFVASYRYPERSNSTQLAITSDDVLYFAATLRIFECGMGAR